MEGNEKDKKCSERERKGGQYDSKASHTNTLVGIVCLSALVAVVSALGYFTGFDIVHHYFRQQSFYETYYNDPLVEPEVINLFMSYDENLDGKIDPKEFVQIAHRMFGRKDSILGYQNVEENWSQSGEKITVNASFEPLLMSSISKFSGNMYSGFDQSLSMLKSWRHLSKPTLTIPVSAFSIFLPPKYMKLGEPWYIVTPQTSKYGPSLSSHRYVPPPVHGNAVLIHRLLSMFHSRPFTMTRIAPQGTAACIQAYNEQYIKVAFRIHAEFQINEPPLLPFWFSPAQFAGTIVISRDGHHVNSLSMAVPNNRSLNVDMEWLLKADKAESEQVESKEKDVISENNEFGESVNMEVDIGYLPKMEIHSIGSSCIRHVDEIECPSRNSSSDIVWESEISQQKAEKYLLEFFYPFQEVSYYPFKDAFKIAQKENKPVHHILLWGALDDQSC